MVAMLAKGNQLSCCALCTRILVCLGLSGSLPHPKLPRGGQLAVRQAAISDSFTLHLPPIFEHESLIGKGSTTRPRRFLPVTVVLLELLSVSVMNIFQDFQASVRPVPEAGVAQLTQPLHLE